MVRSSKGVGEVASDFQYGEDNLLVNMELAYHWESNYFAWTYTTLTKIPIFVGQMKSLTELNLCYNKITSLPKEISKLESLQKLILSGNQLTSLDFGLEKMTSLRVLSLRGKPIN